MSSAQPALRASICDRRPRRAVVRRFAGAQTHARAAEPARPQTYACTSRGRCSCKSSVLVGPGAELQPHATLDRSPSLSQLKLFCLQTICSAPRRAGSGEGAQMDRFFDNSLKRSTQAQRHHMLKGRPARRAVARPSPPWLGHAGSVPCRQRPARTPARSFTCRELASISKGRFVSAEGKAARRRFKLLGSLQPAHLAHQVLISHGLGGTGYLTALELSKTEHGVKRGGWRR